MNINLNEAAEEYARLPFNPYGAHYKRYSAGHREPGYNTELSSFIFALDGKALIYLDGKPFTFGTNRVVHCAPHQCFAAQNENGRPAELFELAYVNDSPYSDYMHSSYELEIGHNPQLFSMLHRLAELSQRVMSQGGPKGGPKLDGYSMLQAKLLTYSIFAEMFSSAQSIRQTGSHSIVEDAKSYIGQHYMEPHTLFELGGRYGMSGKYFAGLFKRYTGISPIDYMITCRLDAAGRLLRSTECSVKEISSSVGYDDPLYFSRHFKSRFGLSPSAWREQAASNVSHE